MSKWRNRITGSGEEAPDQLMANPYNHRIHPEYQQKVMAGVLDEIGWIQDVIVNSQTGHIVDGHLRVELALREDEPAVPVKYVDLDPDDERKALATLDPIGALAEQDQAILDRLIDGIEETTDDDVAAFLETMQTPPDDNEPETEGQTDEDEVPEPKPNTVSQDGDVWIMGNHRIMCGDGTRIDQVEALTGGHEVEMVWTDPPYNVDYTGKTADALKIDGDERGDAEFRQFLLDLFSAAYGVTQAGAPIYIAHADSEGHNFRNTLLASGYLLKQCLIWVKNTMVLGRQDYQWQHKPILYGWKPGAAHKWYGEFNKKTVIDDTPDLKSMSKEELLNEARKLHNALNTSVVKIDKPSRSLTHPTMKPVELIAHMMKNSSRKGDKVLDLCAGSGSTVIAAEKYGRHARAMEADPVYADVLIKRWQDYTGKQATHEASGQAFDDMAATAQPDGEQQPEANA